VTMLPGFPERLEAEVGRLSASHLIPKVGCQWRNPVKTQEYR